MGRSGGGCLAVDRVGVPSSDLGMASVDLFFGSALWGSNSMADPSGRALWFGFHGPSMIESAERPDTRPRTSEDERGFTVSELGIPLESILVMLWQAPLGPVVLFVGWST